MAFFGLTTLGRSNPVRDGNAVHHDYVFHTIDEDKYRECFEKYLLGNSPTAAILEVDGDSHILRASLGDMLRELLGRQPRKHELDAWFTYTDFDRSAVMPRDEFIRAMSGLLDFSAAPKLPQTYTSYEQYRTDWLRHVRLEYERQHACRTPMTDSQAIGWHNIKPGPKAHPHHLNATDVTKREGRTAASYYGHFLA